MFFPWLTLTPLKLKIEYIWRTNRTENLAKNALDIYAKRQIVNHAKSGQTDRTDQTDMTDLDDQTDQGDQTDKGDQTDWGDHGDQTNH